jgi:hypothetical protein
MNKTTKYIMAATGTNTIISQPSKAKPMKPFENSDFYSFSCALQYWNRYAQECWDGNLDTTLFLIEDLENEVYCVIDEDTLYHLQNEFDLQMKILYVS